MSVVIPHSNLAEALATAQSLALILGRDCRIDFSTYTLHASLDAIDKAIEASLEERDTTPVNPNLETVQRDPQIITRIVYPSEEAQLELQNLFLDEETSWIEAKRQKRRIREEAIAPRLEQDITPGSTLIYGHFPVDNAEVIEAPDGKVREVDTVIHWSKPVNPEDAYLRELQVQTTRVIDYQVQGIDLDEDEEPRYELTPDVWRRLLQERLLNSPEQRLSALESSH